MIKYDKQFRFTNDVGDFIIHAYTQEHPSGYGNSTLLVFDIDSDYPCERQRLFDVRYIDCEIDFAVKRILADDYGVRF